MKRINKKYAEMMLKANKACGRKEVVSLLKRAAKLKSKIDYINAA